METFYFITFDKSGSPVKASRFRGDRENKPLSENEVECTEAQFLKYQDYVLVAGEVTQAPESALLERFRQERADALAIACQKELGDGFESFALGSAHFYASTLLDQHNLILALQAESFSSNVWCCDSHAHWAFLPHTRDQIQDLVADLHSFVQRLRTKHAMLLDAIWNARTFEDLSTVQWSDT